eukprot:scaffold20727_cov96-Isochrysis_galbana.AAC.1
MRIDSPRPARLCRCPRLHPSVRPHLLHFRLPFKAWARLRQETAVSRQGGAKSVARSRVCTTGTPSPMQ